MIYWVPFVNIDKLGIYVLSLQIGPLLALFKFIDMFGQRGVAFAQRVLPSRIHRLVRHYRHAKESISLGVSEVYL